MPRQKSPYKRLADDPAFRAMLGPEFAHLTPDDIDIVLELMLETMRETVEEWAATVPYDPNLFIRV